MMNKNGVSIDQKETLINVGLHIEAIDEEGNWCESEIINIIDNQLILKFLKHKETCNRLLDISSDKWRLITNSQKNNNFVLNNDDFKKGDCVLAKWRDGNYYLSQILDVHSIIKFGTKVKEYHIVYLYDNVEEKVSQNRLKSTNSIDQKKELDLQYKNSLMTPTNMLGKRTYRKRSLADNFESQKASDNVFYDEKTKKFTESCKIRRLRLSQANEKEKNNQEFEFKESNNKIENNERVIEDSVKLFDEPKTVILSSSNSNNKPNSKQRVSQRKRRSSFRKADYFYPDSIDHTITDKSKSSNNVSQVSTPVIHETYEEVAKSPRLCSIFSNQTMPESRDCVQSSNHSPISVSLTSTEESPKQKPKPDFFQSELDIKYEENKEMYSCNEDGQFLCLICTNKTFRKKKLVLDHIKHYHPKSSNNFDQTLIPSMPKTRYSPNKRYYSMYLKNNRSTLERKKHFCKFKKSFMNRSLWSTSNRNSGTGDKYPDYTKVHPDYLSRSASADYSDHKHHGDKPCDGFSQQLLPSNTKIPLPSIIYCHRCRKSTEDGYLVQCDVCLCWSHTTCYGLSENKDNSAGFWECDSCANVSSIDIKKSAQWHRDRWRFHSVPHNELPWVPKSALAKNHISSSLKNICEMQSLLSLSQRVLEALTRQLDRLMFKANHDSNSQDDFDILKSLCVYDSIDEIPRLETLDELNLNNDHEELFKVSVSDGVTTGSCLSTEKQLNHRDLSSTFPHFSEINFSNSTPIKTATHGQKSINTSLDGILDCDIQKLEIIPKADFDALVKDLNSCEDIYKKTPGPTGSKPSILDFIDDSCGLQHCQHQSAGKHSRVPRSLESDLPFSQSTCLYQNPHINHRPDTNIFLSAGGLIPLFVDKESQKDGLLCGDLCGLGTGVVSDQEKYHGVDYLLSARNCTDTETKPSIHQMSSATACFPTECSPKPEDVAAETTGSLDRDKSDSKLEMEFIDLTEIMPGQSTSTVDPSSSSAYADSSEMRLNQADSRCLQWLLGKFKCVEKIVESIESVINSLDASPAVADQSSSSLSSSHLESEHSRINKYLQSLLYIMKKNPCQ